jgi:GT2 family glycosyltransferase
MKHIKKPDSVQILVSTIIIHWNTKDHLSQQLDILKSSPSIEIIIVDNNSQGSLQWVTKKYKHIKLINNEENRGFSRACNQGAAQANGRWLLFLNPDTHITSKQIASMVQLAAKQNLDACSSRPDNADYFKPLPGWFSLLVEFTPLRRIIPLSIFKNRSLFGGCILIKNDVYQRIHGWDEDFFLWFEDADITFRLQKERYRSGWVNVPVAHAGGSSFKLIDEINKKKIFFQSMRIYAKKHFTWWGRMIVELLIAINT